MIACFILYLMKRQNYMNNKLNNFLTIYLHSHHIYVNIHDIYYYYILSTNDFRLGAYILVNYSIVSILLFDNDNSCIDTNLIFVNCLIFNILLSDTYHIYYLNIIK